MTYLNLLDALTPCADIYEIAAPQGSTRYIVVNITGLNTFNCDNETIILGRTVQLTIRFQDPADTILPDVCAALTAAGFTYAADGVSYDPDYGLLYSTVDLEVDYGEDP